MKCGRRWLTNGPAPGSLLEVASSFQGGVEHGDARRVSLRALVAVQGSNLEALTSDKTFRIPLARCALKREGEKVVMSDGEGSLVIWSDDEAFLPALEKAQRGTLGDQVRTLQGAARRRRRFKRLALALLALGLLLAASAPATRWAVRGGVPSITTWVGDSTLERLSLPSGIAPATEAQLDKIAGRLRPITGPSTRDFRVLLADYGDVHAFSVPPATVVVTAGLICESDGPDVVTAAVARELAHLENGDLSDRLGEVVTSFTAAELLVGHLDNLTAHALDYADPKRSPGFTSDQESAARDRAQVLLAQVNRPPTPSEDLGALTAQLKRLAEQGKDDATLVKLGALEQGAAVDEWSAVVTEACELIGR